MEMQREQDFIQFQDEHSTVCDDGEPKVPLYGKGARMARDCKHTS